MGNNHIKDMLSGKLIEYKGIELQGSYKFAELKCAIVGTGRCGTVYGAKLISKAGLPCGHEALFKHDGYMNALDRFLGKKSVNLSLISQLDHIEEEKQGLEWLGGNKVLYAESSYMAAPFLDRDFFKDVKIVHFVRHPFKVINSFVSGFKYFDESSMNRPTYKEYHDFIYRHVPDIKAAKDPVSRCALYYVLWNEMIEKKSIGKQYYLQKVESSPKKMLDFLGLEQENYYDKKSNHKLGIEFKINSLSCIPDKDARERIEVISKKYGYQTKLLNL